MYYGQNEEDRIVEQYFGDFVGTFASIGENDGVTFSNVRRLAELGWKGIVLEPSPKAYAKLLENYKKFPNVYEYPFCISHANRDFTLQESSSLIGKGDVGLVSTFHDHEMDRFKSVVQYTPVQVKCFKWKTFLNRVKFKTFDFISVDVEGSDAEVLGQIDLTETKCVCVEFNGKRKQEFVDICKGFRLIHENGENLIFAR